MAVQVGPGFYNRGQRYGTVHTGHVSVGSNPIQVLFQNDGRLGAVVTNTGSVTVYVGTEYDVGAGNGHALLAGNSLSLVTSSELWGKSSGETQLVTFLEEQVR